MRASGELEGIYRFEKLSAPAEPSHDEYILAPSGSMIMADRKYDLWVLSLRTG
jgi:hypothetical protein